MFATSRIFESVVAPEAGDHWMQKNVVKVFGFPHSRIGCVDHFGSGKTFKFLEKIKFPVKFVFFFKDFANWWQRWRKWTATDGSPLLGRSGFGLFGTLGRNYHPVGRNTRHPQQVNF